MNGTEQRAHHTAVTRLAGDVETMFDDLHAKTRTGFERVSQAINDERTARLKLAREQRSYVENEDRKLYNVLHEAHLVLVQSHHAFRSRGFWSRLNWLLTGR